MIYYMNHKYDLFIKYQIIIHGTQEKEFHMC